MKRNSLIMMATLLVSSALPLFADEGADLFKKRCAGCHGAQGEGKPAMKAPSLKSSKLDANQITVHLAKGEASSKPPHNKAISGLKPGQAKAIADYVKTL